MRLLSLSALPIFFSLKVSHWYLNIWAPCPLINEVGDVLGGSDSWPLHVTDHVRLLSVFEDPGSLVCSGKYHVYKRSMLLLDLFRSSEPDNLMEFESLVARYFLWVCLCKNTVERRSSLNSALRAGWLNVVGLPQFDTYMKKGDKCFPRSIYTSFFRLFIARNVILAHL